MRLRTRTPGVIVPIIDRFRGEYFFLSNYSPAPTPYGGRLFPTSEHAYMAAGTTDPDAVAAILAASTSDAQVIGRAARNVENWERRRFQVMDDVVTAKFSHNSELGERLLATGNSLLVEGNDWHDQTWGHVSLRTSHRDARTERAGRAADGHSRSTREVAAGGNT